jgi:DNA-binding response OmpR family regulator
MILYPNSPILYCLTGCCPANRLEVCANIREKGFDKLIIMMTAKAQDIDKIEAYNFGVSDYITKPFNMDVLVAMIDNKIKFSLNSENPNRTSLPIWSTCPTPTS